MSVYLSVPEIFDVKDAKKCFTSLMQTLYHNYNHYVIVGACSAYCLRSHFRRYLKKLMRCFHAGKWSEFCSSRVFQQRTPFCDIFWKTNAFAQYWNKTSADSSGRVDSNCERTLSVSLSVPEIFDFKDWKNALRHNCNHCVIIIIIT